MYNLTKQQQNTLSTVLKEYLNVGDWKGLFAQTGSEEFAQQHTQFYNDDSWDNGSIEDNLDKDSAEALAFILNKDSEHLKIIWELPGVRTMTKRKDENLHAQIEALIENANNQIDASTTTGKNTDTDLSDENQNPYEMLDDAEVLLNSNRTTDAYHLMHAALRNFLQQTCANKEISTDKDDSVSILHAKIKDHIKRQNGASQSSASQNSASLNDTSLSMLRTATFITETIDDLSLQNRYESQFNKAEVKYAINVSRSVMVYIDELIG